eukprot:m.1036884 g.1036884  ORF g.1036884 m.1036884 type:complete len:137 (-) comp24140_c1_seq26:182-592(-)
MWTASDDNTSWAQHGGDNCTNVRSHSASHAAAHERPTTRLCLGHTPTTRSPRRHHNTHGHPSAEGFKMGTPKSSVAHAAVQHIGPNRYRSGVPWHRGSSREARRSWVAADFLLRVSPPPLPRNLSSRGHLPRFSFA